MQLSEKANCISNNFCITICICGSRAILMLENNRGRSKLNTYGALQSHDERYCWIRRKSFVMSFNNQIKRLILMLCSIMTTNIFDDPTGTRVLSSYYLISLIRTIYNYIMQIDQFYAQKFKILQMNYPLQHTLDIRFLLFVIIIIIVAVVVCMSVWLRRRLLLLQTTLVDWRDWSSSLLSLKHNDDHTSRMIIMNNR